MQLLVRRHQKLPSSILYGPVRNFQYGQLAQNQPKSHILFHKKLLTAGLIYNDFVCNSSGKLTNEDLHDTVSEQDR